MPGQKKSGAVVISNSSSESIPFKILPAIPSEDPVPTPDDETAESPPKVFEFEPKEGEIEPESSTEVQVSFNALASPMMCNVPFKVDVPQKANILPFSITGRSWSHQLYAIGGECIGNPRGKEQQDITLVLEERQIKPEKPPEDETTETPDAPEPIELPLKTEISAQITIGSCESESDPKSKKSAGGAGKFEIRIPDTATNNGLSAKPLTGEVASGERISVTFKLDKDIYERKIMMQ
eukprot:842667_1